MAGQVIIPTPKGVWTKVASFVKSATITVKTQLDTDYYILHKDAGSPPPVGDEDAETSTQIRAQETVVTTPYYQDVYIYCTDNGGEIVFSVTDLIPLMFSETLAIKTASVQEDLFANGYSFSSTNYYTFTSGEVKNFLFDPTPYMPPPGAINRVVAYTPDVTATGGPILLEIFEGSTVSANGTARVVYNRDRSSLKTYSTIYSLAPTITNVGTRLMGILIASTTAPVTSNPGASRETLPISFDTMKKYIFRYTNQGGNGVYVGISLTWYEI